MVPIPENQARATKVSNQKQIRPAHRLSDTTVGGPIGTLPGFPDSSTCLTFRGFLCLLVAIHAFEFGLEFLGHEKAQKFTKRLMIPFSIRLRVCRWAGGCQKNCVWVIKMSYGNDDDQEKDGFEGIAA
jgi:hypothetical protein